MTGARYPEFPVKLVGTGNTGICPVSPAPACRRADVGSHRVGPVAFSTATDARSMIIYSLSIERYPG